MPGVSGDALIVFNTGESISLGGEPCSHRRLPKLIADKLTASGYSDVDARLDGEILHIERCRSARSLRDPRITARQIKVRRTARRHYHHPRSGHERWAHRPEPQTGLGVGGTIGLGDGLPGAPYFRPMIAASVYQQLGNKATGCSRAC